MRRLLITCAFLAILAGVGVLLFILMLRVMKATRLRARGLACPNCGRAGVRTSFKSGPMDFVMTMCDCRPYRCIVCYTRFYCRNPMETEAANSAADEEPT